MNITIQQTEKLLKQLPKGKWIGGSTEYFMDIDGGKIESSQFDVMEFNYDFTIKNYDTASIKNISTDGFDNGFSIVIIPFDSDIHKEYAEKAPGYDDIFMKNIVGWISGVNLSREKQTPVALNGMTGEVFTDNAVALHMGAGADEMFCINTVNIFSQDEDSPVIEFLEDGFKTDRCLVNGIKTKFADYLIKNNINTNMPLVGDYSGSGVNISIKKIENGVVHFFAPVFRDIKYRTAKNITNYIRTFNEHPELKKKKDTVFSCNCILNFLYGNLEGKKIGAFTGPVAFGEIACQLVNQTLVYVSVEKS